ncbi:MAG: hypothetical protein ACOYL0_16385, partial [Limnohabitans sp.]
MTVISFTPGLVPVLKHGTHDQSDHGNWARGGKALDPTNADDVREAFTGTIETRAGTVSVVVDSVDVFDFSTTVQGALIGPSGEYHGRWHRTVTPEIKVMYNESLEVAEGSRKSGIGTEFQKHSERAALALGMEKIVIKAADDGKEAWASERFGFDFAGPPSEGLHRAKMAASSPRIDRPQDVKKIEELERRFDGPESDWPKPHEILAVGSGETPYKLYSEHVFYTVPPRQSLGQSILSHGWDGKKPASRVTKQAEPEMFYVIVESDYADAAKHGTHDQSDHGNWARDVTEPPRSQVYEAWGRMTRNVDPDREGAGESFASGSAIKAHVVKAVSGRMTSTTAEIVDAVYNDDFTPDGNRFGERARGALSTASPEERAAIDGYPAVEVGDRGIVALVSDSMMESHIKYGRPFARVN